MWRNWIAPVSADIAIIGAGYTGLSAALRAIERDLHPVIIEASEVGFGASGRNGGVVSTKFRVSLSDMAKRHGTEIARRMSRLGHEAMDCVEHYVESCGIATSGFAKTDNLRCAHNALACPLGEARGQRRRAHRAARNGQGEASHHRHERLLRRDARDVCRAHGGHSVSQCDDRDGTAPE
jgi:glycine/D-amino acid oxidase-like deaminating enzyme